MQRNQEIFRKNTHPCKSDAKTQKNKDLHGRSMASQRKLLMKLKSATNPDLLI